MKALRSFVALVLFSLAISFLFFSGRPIEGLSGGMDASCNVFCKIGIGTKLGTGNFINNRAHPYVITCKHVTENANPILVGVITKDNRPITCPAKLVVESKNSDYSILQVRELPPEGRIVNFGTDNLSLGDRIHFFGLIARPGKPFLHYGYISQKNVVCDDNYLYHAVNTTVINGSSGSVVYNKDFKGIGITCIHMSDSQMGYLPIDAIRESLFNSGIRDLYGILDGECNVSLFDKYGKVIQTP